jgi:ubiquinone/menaquinone biosynthesis C-methylase UbiE
MANLKNIPKIFTQGIPSYYIQVSSMDRRLLKGEPIKGKKILNVGCGNHIFDDICLAMKGADIVGIDYSHEAVKKAKEKLKIAKKRHLINNIKIKVEHGDGRNLKFKDNYFDIVTSYSAIEHMPSRKDRLKMVKEMARVTKRGGVVVITVPNYLNFPTTFLSGRTYKRIKEFEYRYTPSELKKILIANNLKIEKFDAESVYVIDKRLIETRLPLLKFIPPLFFKPLSWMLWTFNAVPLFKKFGMRMGYRTRKI